MAPDTSSDRHPHREETVVVVGGGVIGLAIAWRAAESGFDVRLVDPEPGAGASAVAGGMLAPVTEAWPGEEEALELGAASLTRWPDFAERLRRATGREPGLSTAGTVAVAIDTADVEELTMLGSYLTELGRDATWMQRRELHRLEPALGPAVRGGLLVPGDLSVDNRRLLAVLRSAMADSGVRHIPATAIRVHGDPPTVETGDGSPIRGEVVVLAAGAWSGDLHPGLRMRIRPVKGEALRLGARAGTIEPPTRTVRAAVEGRPVYVVPRADGVVVGATQYEAGFDPAVTVAGVRDLLLDAERVLPGLSEYEFQEASVGFRPGSPDNLPVIDWLEPGVIAATGHGRNGFLLAPITADRVLELLDRTRPPDAARRRRCESEGRHDADTGQR